MIELVRRYFAAVDGEDFAAIASTLAEDCVFTVETHAIRLEGLDEIREMFVRLWADHAAVRHYDFVHVAAPGDGRVATRFSVVKKKIFPPAIRGRPMTSPEALNVHRTRPFSALRQ